MNQLNNLAEVAGSALHELRVLDWSDLQFKRGPFALWAALLLGAALLLKILWPYIRERQSDGYYEHSGYRIFAQAKPGSIYKIFSVTPLVTVILASAFLLIATADPYLTRSNQAKIEESREIIYLRDTSTSMGFKMGERSRGEILQEFLLELIKERQGKNDRAAYMIFASEPRLYADFTTDNDSLLFSVATGPIVTADAGSPTNFLGIFILKEFEVIPFEGGTELGLGFDAAMRLFESKGNKKITKEMKENPSVKKRSIVILTDGASERDPEPQFKELQKRNIIPYLIFIDPDRETEKKFVEGQGRDSATLKLPDMLLRQVRQYGGQYFLAKDKTSMSRIRKKLDELHTSVVGSKTYVVELHIYRTFLVIAILFYALALLLRLLFWKFNNVV